MTYFLPEMTETPKIKARKHPREISSTIEGWGAGVTKGAIENDANFMAARKSNEVRRGLVNDAIDRLPLEKITPFLQGTSGKFSTSIQGVESVGNEADARAAVKEIGGRQMDKILELAREQAIAHPDLWSDIDLTEEGIEAEVNRRLQADYKDAVETLEMMPNGSGMAEFIGGMVGITLDVKNLPFMLVGGGSGSFLRVAGREAMINASAEAAFLPAQFSMAERLEIPDPDIATQLMMAAGAGAGFGLGFEATRRGFTYFKARNTVTPAAGYDDLSMNVMVDTGEDALASGSPDALSEIAEIPFKTTRTAFPDNQINPERPPLVLTSEQRVFTTPLPKVDGGAPEPLSKDALIENITKAIDEAKKGDTRGKRPLTDLLKGNHKKKDAHGLSNESLQVHPDGFMGQELKARGITPKMAPGLFSRERGRTDFDNMIASEMEELFPGIMDATGTPHGADYLDRDGFIDVLARDIQGDTSYLRARQDIAAMEKDLEAVESDAVSDFVRFENTETPNGLFLTQDQVEFMEGRDLDVLMDDWFDRSGYGALLDDVEKQEIRAEIGKSGGDPEYLVERVLEREADFVEGRFDGPEGSEAIPFDGPVRADGPSTGEPQADAGQARSRDEGQGGRGANAGQSEITDAGEQIVAPGIAPVSTRQRLEAAQDAPLRGGDTAPDHGLFDVTARSQVDMFDDVTSAEARAADGIVSNDLQAEIEAGGNISVEIELPDGTTKKMLAKDALKHLDEGDTASARLSLCGKGSE